MDQKIKADWVAALRSGEYEQGKGALCVLGEDGSKKYCCLGVLCELAVKAGLDLTTETVQQNLQGNEKRPVQSYDDSDAYLPQAVMAWADLDMSNPWVTGGSLAGKNDTGNSFATIADLIEHNL